MHTRTLQRSQPMRAIWILLALVLALVSSFATTVGAQSTGERESEFDAARELLRAGQYRDAARAFERIERGDADDEITARSLYWRAFALQREGGRNQLREAAKALELQFERFPDTAQRGDSAELAVQIQADLARLGDAEAAARIAALADEIRARNGRNGEGETRVAALNALMQMSPERAVPILRKILQEKPEGYSDELREKAVFIVSQHGGRSSDVTIDVLTHVVAHDRSPKVREQAVFWLSQTGNPRAVAVLTDLLSRESERPELREKAIFALSQVGGSEARATLRNVALDRDQPQRLREQAVFWISQGENDGSIETLIEVYENSDSSELRDKAIFAASQVGGTKASDFLLSIVRDGEQTIENRKQALFWLGQRGEVDVAALLEVFDTSPDVEMQEQVVFVLSQIESRAAVDALIAIARGNARQDLREKAIFWLGQTNDDRAAEFLAALLEEEF